MPALQVRDLPEDLYEDLKACAESEHRSIAQQTIVAIEEMLQNRKDPGRKSVFTAPIIQFETQAEKEERLRRRQEVFKKMEELPWRGPVPTSDDIIKTIHEGREERTNRILASIGSPKREEVAS